MAYKLNGKSYTDHALMDEVIYNAKLIINGIILKNTRVADLYETEDMMLQADYLLAIDNGSMMLNFFPFTKDMLMAYGYDRIQAADIMVDWTLIPKEDRESLLDFCCKWFVDHYEEKNPYYRHLNGLPSYGTDEYNIYINPDDPKLFVEDANVDFNYEAPLHEYSTRDINTLEALGIMNDIRAQYTGFEYSYIHNLGTRKIDPIKARIAKQWDILWMPDVEFLVKSRFKQLYAINRDIYMRRTYQEAYIYMSDYYDEAMMLMITCQTLSDLINELPEWYIRRDIFDLRSVKYFLDSNGVKFFKEIPLKFQIKIVKNLNRLIRYKSTTKNILDILEIFRQEGTTVYKYYIFKHFLYNKNFEDETHPILPEPFDMADYSWDFGLEDEDNIMYDPEHGGIMWDMLCDSETDVDHSGECRIIDFGDEDDDTLLTGEETDKVADAKERDRIIHDENGNVYKLEFVRVPIDGSYDDYIKDEIYREEYDTVTLQDKYWDGENTHYLVRNNHLKKDFTLEGTKYMILDYSISASDYFYQICYFLGLLFNSNIDTDDIVVSIPSISTDVDFSLTDICVFLVCVSNKFNNMSLDIKLPDTEEKAHKHPFYKYIYANGGLFYDGADEEKPDPEPEEPAWEFEWYDFGDEDVDNIKYDPLYGTMYDFGYDYTIDPDKEIKPYDGREITETSEEPILIPREDPWWINWVENGGSVSVNGSDEAIRDYLEHNGYKTPENWWLGDWYDFGVEGKDGEMDFGDESVSDITPSLLYDGGDLDVADTPIDISKFEFGDMETDEVEVGDEYTKTLNAANNCVGDCYNYDFYDEREHNDFMSVYYRYHRMYDFNLGDPDYDPVPPPPPNVPWPWWENLPSHKYEMELDGRYPKRDEHGLNHNWANGGNGVRYTEITHDSFYNWMNTDNPQLFIPTSGRIFGFNVTADIEKIKKYIAIRHSDFQWQHGYSLEDFGLDGFECAEKISSMEELIRVYRANSECYKNLEEQIENRNDTRDKMVTMKYLFNSLFTTPLDKSFYRLKSGEIASSYDQILKERNLILYRYYKELLKEENVENRKDMIRDILNQIVSILEYYTGGTDDLKYVWSWIPTNSFQAIIQYIQLMINFFKSWKVYFLDPHVTYRLDDKKENMVGVGDQIVEKRIGQWVSDNASVTDNVTIGIHLFVEENGGVKKEIVDIMAYQQPDINRGNAIDGKRAFLTDEQIENMLIANGGVADKLGSIPYILGDGGWVAARYDIYNLDGGSPLNMQEYLTLDGGRVMSYTQMRFPIHGDWSDVFAICDGGNVEDSLSASKSIASYIREVLEIKSSIKLLSDDTSIDDTQFNVKSAYNADYETENTMDNNIEIGDYVLEHNVILSTKKKNSIKILPDGIYFGEKLATQDEVDTIVDDMTNTQSSYIDLMRDLGLRVETIPDFGEVETNVENCFANILEHPEWVLNDMEENGEQETSNEYTDNKINDLIDWFNDMVPFEEWEFKP